MSSTKVFQIKEVKVTKMTTGDEINEDLPTIAEDLVVTKYKMAAEIVHSKRFTFTL